jgi:hypothetical protein
MKGGEGVHIPGWCSLPSKTWRRRRRRPGHLDKGGAAAAAAAVAQSSPRARERGGLREGGGHAGSRGERIEEKAKG